MKDEMAKIMVKEKKGKNINFTSCLFQDYKFVVW